MPGETAIEWTRGDDGSPGRTWNPVTGCTRVSAGCDHCYAKRFAERFRGVPGHPYEQGFDLRLWHDRLGLPLRWTKPRRIFVNSMSDLFHADVPDSFVVAVFAVMAAAPWHQFLILTKRPQRMKRNLTDPEFQQAVMKTFGTIKTKGVPDHFPGWPLPNVWMGASVENQDAAWRINWLARTPAAVRFLSCEPLLGPIELTPWLFPVAEMGSDGIGRLYGEPGASLIDWVIAGGESGPGARPMHPDWARGLRDECVLARVPFFFKQWGGVRAKAGGRELDGRTWDEMPGGIAA